MTDTSLRAAPRLVYLDNLKVVLIGLIIVLHAILGYSTAEVWTYTEFREVTLSPAVEIPLFVLAAPFGFFMIGLLFLVAGLFTGPSLARKGAAVFARDRMVRLGVPFTFYVLLVQPTVTYALQHPLGDAPGSYWQEWLAEEDHHRLDSGPLWFVGVLLVFSLLVAAAYAARDRRAKPGTQGLGGPPGITTGRLLALSALVAVTSFPIRLLYPYGGESGFWDLNLWEWPACLAAFLLGIAASRRGWIEAVPSDLDRLSRRATVTAMVAMAALLLTASLRDAVEDLMGGWQWYAAAFALVDGVLVVFGPVWLLAVAQRRLREQLPRGAALARSAFGAFIVQTPVLVGLAGALRPLELPAEVKALVVAGLGVTLSFALAWLLVTRVPGVRRIL